MPKPASKFVWWFTSVNALAMLLLALFWLSLPHTYGDEAFFIKWTSVVKKALLGLDERPPSNSILFVDVSGSKKAIELPDPLYEEPTGYHKMIITDREQMAQFFALVSKYGEDIPLVLIDILFQEKSPDDALLQTTFDSLPFPVVAARGLEIPQDEKACVFDIPNAVAAYQSTKAFMKYPLYLEDSLPTLPLVAHSLTSGKTHRPGLFWTRIGEKLSLSNPIIDFKIRPYYLSDGSDFNEEAYHLRSMGTLLFEWDFWEEEDIRALLKGRTIVIGDFVNDVHSSVHGSIPGPLIVYNTYLTIKAGETFFSISWLLLLLALFVWMSYRIYREEERGHKKWKWLPARDTAVGKIIADNWNNTLFLTFGTILSYFIFNIHINILGLLIYLNVITYLLKKFHFKNTSFEENT